MWSKKIIMYLAIMGCVNGNRGNYPYRIGLNTLLNNKEMNYVNSFRYTTPNNIFYHIIHGDKVCIINIPKDAQVKNISNEFICNKIIIEKIMPIWDVKTMKYLISIGANIHYRNDCILHLASEKGHLDVVQYLVSVGANIHSDNDAAIRWASMAGQLDVVQYLVFMGANVHTLRYATYSGNLDLVKYLVSMGAKVHDRDLQLASELGHLDLVKYFVSHGVDIQAHAGYDHAIRYARKYGHIHVVQYLLLIEITNT